MPKSSNLEIRLLNSILKKGESLGRDQEALLPGALLSLLRQTIGMTQTQLSSKLKMPQSTISRIERGLTQPNLDTLRKIFSVLGCEVALVPIPRFASINDLLRQKAKALAEKRLAKLEGTMALEGQLPEKKWREELLESEIQNILESPSQIWDDNGEI